MTTTYQVIQMLIDYFYGDNSGNKFSDAKLKTYLKTLSDIEPDVLERAAFEYIKGAKEPYFPRVSELRKFSEQVQATPADDEHKTMYWNAMSAFFSPEAYTDRRYSRYFRAPGRYEDLSEDARDWWDGVAIEVEEVVA